MGDDRRTLIADAVITTLARAGSRGLTHRAVDDAAGLPRGSTSYYLRTRASLMDAAVSRLAEIDTIALHPRIGEPLAGALARALDELRGAQRDRTVARYELSLEALRRPELREALDGGSRRVRAALVEVLEAAGVADADVAAGDVMALFDGLLFRELTALEGTGAPRTELRRAIERVISSSA